MRSFIIRPALSSLYQKGQVSKRITVEWCILYIVTLRNLLTGSGRSPPLSVHVGESLDSGFHPGDSGFRYWIPDPCQWNLHSGFRIFNCYSKPQDSRFHLAKLFSRISESGSQSMGRIAPHAITFIATAFSFFSFNRQVASILDTQIWTLHKQRQKLWTICVRRLKRCLLMTWLFHIHGSTWDGKQIRYL